MEIVNNGALLESQILEDARARARRLLEAADRECDQVRAQAEESLREELARADRAREERIATLRRELAASLPLDSRRTRLAFLQEALDTALVAWFGGLPRAEVDRLVSFRLARAGAAFADRTIVVQHAGMDEARARRIAAESLPGAIVDTVVAMEPDEAAAAGTGLVVACSDGSRRCRATVGEMKIQLLDEHREELITALYGKDALE